MTDITKLRGLLITALTIVLFSATIYGAYIENMPHRLIQPDGEIIDCFASGDEFFNYAHDENGFTIIVGDDGYYYYAMQKGEEVVPSSYRVNTVDPAIVGLAPGARISERLYQERRQALEVPLERSGTRAPHTGLMNNIVVYIRFADDSPFTRHVGTYDTRLNSLDTQSVRDYFLEVSYDQLDIVSHHFPDPEPNGTILSYQDTQPRSHFRPYHQVNNPNGYRTDRERRTREHSMLVRAIQGVRDEIPEDLDIDADNDGRVDNVCFIIRGNADAWADLLWAHRWVLYTYNVQIHGKRVYDYTFQPENQTGTRTLAHEMFHTLGAPDLYRYSHDGYVPVGPWDLMASGFVHMGAWMKYKYAQRNWITHIPEINSSGIYSLKPITSETNNAYFIRSPYSNRQFFVLEYRRREGRYESSVPGNGLLVYRVNTSADGNASAPPDEVYIYRPNGTTTENGSVNLANFSSQVDRIEINDFNTNPTSFLSNGTPGGLHIHDIGAAGDSITFSVTMIGDLVAPIMDRPQDNAVDVGIQPTFEWGYINVADYYSLQVAKDSLFNDIVVDETNIPNTEYALTQRLEVEHSYFWRVSSSDEEETSEWSEPWKFTVSHFSAIEHDITGASYGGIAWGDIDNDGLLDIVVTGEDRTVILKNLGNGVFEPLDSDLPALRRSSIALGDINNNGLLDMILIGRNVMNEPQAYVCINGGNLHFAAMDGGLTGAFNGNIALGDYNNNGLLDIAIIGDTAEGHLTAIYENTGENFFTRVETADLPGVIYGDVAWADFNNNGKLDLIISGTSREGGMTNIYRNNGDGTFSLTNSGLAPASGSSISVADINNNGFVDIAVSGSSPSGARTKIYRNNGDGTFTDIGADIPGVALGEIAFGDFDMNGYPDLLIAGSNSSRVFRNIDGVNFSEVVSGMRNISFSAAAWADFDNDGDLDVAIIGAGHAGSVLNIYRNNIGSNEFTVNTPPAAVQNPTAQVNQCTVTLLWDKSTDEQTPQEGLTYNISIGTTPGSEDYLSSMSDLSTGYRRLPAPGSVGANNEITLSFPLGTYYWRVQAVDSFYAGSPFSAEGTFTVHTVSAEQDELIAPLQTKLGANYPNPFNPQTTINFTIGKKESVNLSVFNIIGQRVATVVNETLLPGEYSFVWNTDNNEKTLGSGVYFYRLETDSYKEIRKMLLLR